MKLLMVNNKLVSRNGNLLSTDLSPTGGGGMQPVTYAELKSLRDNGQLVAGRQYRITDYECTTTQANTTSAGHPFDIIVTADSESVLNENARAIQHEEEVEEEVEEDIPESAPPTFKPEITVNGDGTLPEGAVIKYYNIMEDFGSSGDGVQDDYKTTDIFVEYGYAENNLGDTVPVLYKTDEGMMDEGADYNDTFFYVGKYELDGEIYDRWRKIEINGDTDLTWDSNSKVYLLTNVIVDGDHAAGKEPPYFAESNLAAWQLKYCLDNDKTRFGWATAEGLTIHTDDGFWFTNTGTLTHEGITYYKWSNAEWAEGVEKYLLSYTLDLVVDDTLHHIEYTSDGEINDFSEDYSSVLQVSSGGGKGVIYFMRDEWGNECHYDFKNILYNGYYTFTHNGKDGSIKGQSTQNVIGSYFVDDVQYINGIVIWYKSKCVTFENGVAYFHLDMDDGNCLQNIRVCSGVAGQLYNIYFLYSYGDRPFETKYIASESQEVILDEI